VTTAQVLQEWRERYAHDCRTAREMLVRARALVEHPEHWTQLALARNQHGRPVEPTADDAQRWCSLGALYAIADQALDSDALCYAASALARTTPPPWREYYWTNATNVVVMYNDSYRTAHADVLAWFSRAIARMDVQIAALP
jgi:hypothetical protein